MPEHVIIDGNNLWHSIQTRAPASSIGRERLVRLVESWARLGAANVTLVFDGAAPRGGLARQMQSLRITVRFSAPRTADDVIVDIINAAPIPGDLRVVSNDTAVGHAARYRRCRHVSATEFIEMLFSGVPDAPVAPETPAANAHRTGEGLTGKPLPPSREETDEWLKAFEMEPEEERPFDGYDSMSL
jgi:predicted RNA-binding protein with PIN domain